MNTRTATAGTFAGTGGQGNIRGWIVFAGIAMVVLGILAIIYDATATIVSVVLFGWLLLLAGIVQTVNAFQVRTWNGFFLYLLDGVIRATVGALLVLYPGSGALGITLVLSFYFIAGGLFKTIASTILQFPSWGWTVMSGLISVALGIMLAMQWPTSGTWFVGFAVGLDLMLYGWALLMFAAAIKTIANVFA